VPGRARQRARRDGKYRRIAKKEPAGIVRIGCSVVLAQNYLAPILPHYLATHPKVTVVVEHGDRWINPLDSDLDLALTTMVEALPRSSLVAREIGRVRRILVTGRTSAGHVFAPDHPDILAHLPLIARIEDMHDGEVRWALTTDDGRDARVAAQPRLVTNDQNVQFEAAASGAGIALLPESVVASALDDGTLVHVLPEWSTPNIACISSIRCRAGSCPRCAVSSTSWHHTCGQLAAGQPMPITPIDIK
jgi:DNA-binding transcriptional LysR family regulator